VDVGCGFHLMSKLTALSVRCPDTDYCRFSSLLPVLCFRVSNGDLRSVCPT
jgi:hypothetical protein